MQLIICQSADNDANNDYNLYLLAPDDLRYAAQLVDREIQRIKEQHPNEWDCSMIVEAVSRFGITTPDGQLYAAEQV